MTIAVEYLDVASWGPKLGKRTIEFMQTCRFDEAAAALTRLVETELGSGHGPPHPRRIAHTWSEIAEVAAAQDRSLLIACLQAAESRFTVHGFTVPQIVDSTADLARARAALSQLLERDNTDLAARECLVRTLIRSDEIETAEREIERNLVGRSDCETIESLRGRAAMRKQDWNAASVAWTRYGTARPNDRDALLLIDRISILRYMAEGGAINGSTPPLPIAPGFCEDPQTRDLLLRFESIGTSCDFASVQRRYGAEPLGLLRWAVTDLCSLLSALAARFEGTGDPATTRLAVVGASRHIFLYDLRWGLPMDTFLREGEVDLAALYPKMCKRTTYLRDKFLNDLRNAAKALVFKADLDDMQQLFDLHSALRSIGPVKLLNVRSAAGSSAFPADEPGRVRQIKPGLFIGQLSAAPAENQFEEWVCLCRNVELLYATSRDGISAPASPPARS